MIDTENNPIASLCECNTYKNAISILLQDALERKVITVAQYTKAAKGLTKSCQILATALAELADKKIASVTDKPMKKRKVFDCSLSG